MAAITFLYRSTLPEAKLKIRLFYSLDKKKQNIEVFTKIKVTKVYWEKYHVAKRISDVSMKNMQAQVIRSCNDIENYIIDKVESVEVAVLSKDWLEDVVEQYYKQEKKIVKQKEPEFLDHWFDRYMIDRRLDASIATIKKAHVIKQLILRFQKDKKRKLNVRDVDVKFRRVFEEYCLQNGYSQNTISRTMVFIKTVCNHAKIFDVEISSTIDLFKTKREKVKNIYLDEREIELLEQMEPLSETLENAKDWLLISCYTGQRVSDFMRFDKNMIRYQKGRDGALKAFIEFGQQKTKKLMSIPLSSKVMSILDKRNGEFPIAISDQKYNDFIKEVCMTAGIDNLVEGSKKVKLKSGDWRKVSGVYKKWELVSSHIGRRSFATNNYGKIPTVFLMNMTGHGSESMFLTYIGKGSNDIAMELSEYFD